LNACGQNQLPSRHLGDGYSPFRSGPIPFRLHGTRIETFDSGEGNLCPYVSPIKEIFFQLRISSFLHQQHFDCLQDLEPALQAQFNQIFAIGTFPLTCPHQLHLNLPISISPSPSLHLSISISPSRCFPTLVLLLHSLAFTYA
jgi:hypothetical protein